MKRTLYLIIITLIFHQICIAGAKDLKPEIAKAMHLKEQAFGLKPQTSLTGNSHFKSAVAITTLDSIIGTDGSHTTMSYNSNGQLLSLEDYALDSWSETISIREKIVFEYDSKGNETLYLNYASDYMGGLTLEEKNETKWDNKNQMTETISWGWNDDKGAFLPSEKEEFEYGENSSTMISSTYDPEQEIFVADAKYIFYYRTDNQRNYADLYTTDEVSGEWILYGKWEFQYNANGLETRSAMKIYDEESEQYLDMMIFESEYDNNGNLVHSKDYMVSEGMTLVLSEHQCEYSSSGLLTLDNEYASDWFTGELVLVSQYRYSYENKILKERIEAGMNYETQQVQDLYKIEFAFEKDNNSLSIARPASNYDLCDDEYFRFGRMKTTKFYNFDFDAGNFAIDNEKTYYYSSGSSDPGTGTTDMNRAIRLYPNPFAEYIRVELPSTTQYSLSVTDINGKVLYRSEQTGNALIYPSIPNSGLYLVEISENNKVVYRSALIRK